VRYFGELAVGGAFLLIAAIVREARALMGWVRRRVVPTPPPEAPPVTIGSIGASISLTQDERESHRRLSSVRPRFEVRNHGEMPLTRVLAGIRPRGTRGGSWQLDWFASIVPPRTHALIDGVEIPPEMLDGVHESVAQRAFTFWVRFNDHRGQRWEVAQDPQTGDHEWLPNPEALDPGGEAAP
jgi:hypothetical protein